MTHDILICGAGPAGTVAAQKLAAAGARVVLVGAASRPGWEGLSARSRALLAEEGMDGSAGVIAGPFARRGVWAGGRPVDGTEWVVERTQLAATLRARACDEGADCRPDVVTAVRRVADHWRACLRSGEALAAPVLVDARGRRGAQRRGPLLLAIGQGFRKRNAGPSGTGIGVTDAGWCWWAEHGDALWIQVVGRPRSGRPSEWIAAAAMQVPALAHALDGACADGDPVARPAHARLGIPGADPTLWQVGDAALALDPLSGQGVYEAVRGARLVATAIQSVLGGGDVSVARRFIAERREQAWQHGVSVAAGFYRENSERGSFWSETAAEYEALLLQGAPGLDGASLPDGASLRAGALRIERRPVLDGGRILERDVVVTADHPRGVWHVAGVPLAALKDYIETAEHASADAAAVALGRPPAAVASAMNWLQERGPMLRQVMPRVSSGG